MEVTDSHTWNLSQKEIENEHEKNCEATKGFNQSKAFIVNQLPSEWGEDILNMNKKSVETLI